MAELLSLGREIGVLFVYVFLGALGRLAGILSVESDKVVSNIIFYFTMPALTIASMSLSVNTSQLYEGLLVLISAIVLVCLSYSFVVFVSRVFKIGGKMRDAFCFGSMFGNVTYLGFPICYLLFGKIGIFYAALYSLGHNLLFWTMGVWIIGKKDERHIKWSDILNINVISIAVGSLLAVTHISVPNILLQPLNGLGEATVPLALMLVGSMMADEGGRMLVPNKLASLSAAVKLVVLPGLTLLLLRALPFIAPIAKTVVLLEMGMPAAALAPAVARKYDGAYNFLSQVVVVTTLISLIIVPVLAWLSTY